MMASARGRIWDGDQPTHGGHRVMADEGAEGRGALAGCETVIRAAGLGRFFAGTAAGDM